MKGSTYGEGYYDSSSLSSHFAGLFFFFFFLTLPIPCKLMIDDDPLLFIFLPLMLCQFYFPMFFIVFASIFNLSLTVQVLTFFTIIFLLLLFHRTTKWGDAHTYACKSSKFFALNFIHLFIFLFIMNIMQTLH